MCADSATQSFGSADGLASLKTEFLASLNYEVRTPLTGILGMTDLLLETPLNAEQKEYVESVRFCAEDLLALFNKTIEYSELISGRVNVARQEFYLPGVVRGVVSAFVANAREKGLCLVCRLAPTLPDVVIGDASRIQRVINHLIDNAVKFTERGRIEVSAAGEVGGSKLDLHVRVQDTGIGIPRDKLPLVFEAFRQLDGGLSRSYDGLGLGLPLVQKLTALLGGDVSVESEPGRGSIFAVTLPLDLPAWNKVPAKTETSHHLAET
jgi:signal transduction histidine kinase